MSQEVSTSGSHASARDPKLHFGLGQERVLSVEVVWPSGIRDRIDVPQISSILVIKEGVGLLAARPFERSGAQ
jgi:hypothetical protein